MHKTIHTLALIVLVGATLGVGCSTNTTTSTNVVVNTVVGTDSNTNNWFPDKSGPWDGVIKQATSSDGLEFTVGDTIVEQAGVPNLLRLQSGELVLTYQYFSSESEDLFDVMAYSVSTDNAQTWSDIQPIQLSGLPVAPDTKKRPMDPTLVQLPDGRLRLYFTFHAQGNATAALYSATTTDANIASTFVVEPTPALMVDDQNLLDPAVILFENTWHHFTWKESSDDNVHSTSVDGIDYERQADINLPMDFLGQVIAIDDGLRFYGTGKNGVVSATSTDGSSWVMDDGQRVVGADPGVQQLPDGSYVMIYTSLNFNPSVQQPQNQIN